MADSKKKNESNVKEPSISMKKEEPSISMEDVITIDENTELVKIFGLQRSGTNWLSFLIKENFNNVETLINTGGWKHGHYMVPWSLQKEAHVATIIKNPYSWLVSVYNYWGPKRKKNIGPDLRGVEFKDFVRNRYLGEKQRGIPFLIRAKNPVQQWNNMNIHWLSIRLANKRSCFVTYETIMANLSRSMEVIGKTLELEQKNKDKWVDNKKTFLPGDDSKINVSKETFNKAYYQNESWKSFYTPELIEFINGELDLDLMTQFGYTFLAPEELCH